MKANATLEDFQNREKFLIKYLKKQIAKYGEVTLSNLNSFGKVDAYKDILFKLEKDGTESI